MRKSDLNRARKNKRDEFYTQRCTVDEGLAWLLNIPSFKRVYCPCDTFESAFVQWAHYHDYQVRFSGEEDGGYEAHWRDRDWADVVITNPPFSLFRDFYKWLRADDGVPFVVLSNLNTLCTKGLEQDWIEKRIRSFVPTCKWFAIPAHYENYYPTTHYKYNEAGEKMFEVPGARWLTNLVGDCPRPLRPKPWRPCCAPILLDDKTVSYGAKDSVPEAWRGEIAVTPTWIDYYDPEKHDITKWDNNPKDMDGNWVYKRYRVRCQDWWREKCGCGG